MAPVEEKKLNRSSLAPYGESVKRHLESFDLEASLNEVRICTCLCALPGLTFTRWRMALDTLLNSQKSIGNERTKTNALA